MTEENDYTSGISATLKASEGFDAPWIVVHARNTEELIGHLTDLHESPVMTMVAQLNQQFQGNFEQKLRYQGNRSGWSGTRRATGATGGAAQSPPSQPAAASPPPFVQNQQAQPAQWGQQQTPQAVQQLQQNLGAQVMTQAPNDVAHCATHNAPRQYFDGGTSRATGKQYGPSWRCQVQGCKPVWQNQDGTWG